MKAKLPENRTSYYLFLLASFFMIISTLFSFNSLLSEPLVPLFFVLIVLYLVFSIIFLSERSNWKAGPILKIVFFIFMLIFISIAIISTQLAPISIYTFEILPALFLLIFLMYFVAAFSRIFLSHKILYLFAASVIILAAIFLVLWFFTGTLRFFGVNDEQYISYLAAKSFLSGNLTYKASFLPQLLNVSSIGLTFTTNNNIISSMSYPALYFLAQVPLYLLYQSSYHGENLIPYVNGMDNAEIAAFFFMALIVAIYSIDKRYLSNPKFGIIFALLFMLYPMLSPIILLAASVLILAYAKLESRYSWIILGIGLSIHNILWPAIMLLILYSFNFGLKKGMHNLFGAIIIFLLINGYFISQSPSAFISNVISPAAGNIFPNPTSLLSFPAEYFFNVSMPWLKYLLIAGMLLSISIFLYFNNKLLVGMLSLLAILFISHSIMVYFTLFISFTIFCIFLPASKSEQSFKSGIIAKNKRIFGYCILFMLLLIPSIIYFGHEDYMNSFGISISSQSLSLRNSTLLYNFSINKAADVNATMYLIIYGNINGRSGYFGLINESLLLNQSECTDSTQCQVNRNIIHVDSQTYRATAVLNDPVGLNYSSGGSMICRCFVSAMLYNGNYVYIGGAASLHP